MTLDLEALKAAAQAATPGPWGCHTLGGTASTNPELATFLFGPATRTMDKMQGFSAEDATHMALANPAAVLALIERLERAEVDATRLHTLLTHAKAVTLTSDEARPIDRLVERLDAIGDHAREQPKESAKIEYVTVVESQRMRCLIGARGIDPKLAYDAFDGMAPLVEVYTGKRHVFYCMADFEKWRLSVEPQQGAER